MKCMQYLKLIHSFSGWNVHLAIHLQLVLQKIKMDIEHVLEKQNNFVVFMLNFRGARKGDEMFMHVLRATILGT